MFKSVKNLRTYLRDLTTEAALVQLYAAQVAMAMLDFRGAAVHIAKANKILGLEAYQNV